MKETKWIETIDDKQEEIFRVFPTYHELPRERKVNGLFLLKDWVQSELEKLIKE